MSPRANATEHVCHAIPKTPSIRLTRQKISDHETGATVAARSGGMENTQSTHIELSRGSLHRLVRP
jgi:hypothetical protein